MREIPFIRDSPDSLFVLFHLFGGVYFRLAERKEMQDATWTSFLSLFFYQIRYLIEWICVRRLFRLFLTAFR